MKMFAPAIFRKPSQKTSRNTFLELIIKQKQFTLTRNRNNNNNNQNRNNDNIKIANHLINVYISN